jgi:hypothetical protein
MNSDTREDFSWSREALFSILQKADEDQEGPVDKPTLVKRLNVLFQGKRRKISDHIVQTQLNLLVKADQVSVVYPHGEKRTPYYVIEKQGGKCISSPSAPSRPSWPSWPSNPLNPL